jgi:FAD/FMN-containing dehydrogenase
LRELSDAAIEVMVDSARRATSPLSLLALYQLGGAARLGEAAFCLNVAATWVDPAEGDRHIVWAREAAAQIQPHAGAGAYVNFLGDEGRQGARSAFGDGYERLRALKNEYDPGNFFRLNQNIEPAA